MADWSFDDYPAEDPVGAAAKQAAIAWLADYWRGEKRNIFSHGPTGAGKSGLLYAIGRRLVIGPPGTSWCDTEVRFRNVLRTLGQVRRATAESVRRSAAYDDDDGDGEEDPVEDPTDDLIEADVLILDDIGGGEKLTDFGRQWLTTVIGARWDAGVPILCTSNYSPSQLVRQLNTKADPAFGARTVSRLADDALEIRLNRGDQRGRLRRPSQPEASVITLDAHRPQQQPPSKEEENA
jgi:DNA replication protein DnaC